MTGPTIGAPAVKAVRKTKGRKRAKPDPALAWTRWINRYRPRLVDDVLDGLATLHGRPTWRRRLDPTAELVLTILTQNTADTNAEVAFEALRVRWPSSRLAEGIAAGGGWGGRGIEAAAPPDWLAVEQAPLADLIEVIRPGGLAPQKSPVIQAALRRIREERRDHSLEFLATMAPLDARAWLTAIPGIGKKTASVVLMHSFGMPLMAVDRHIERVSKRIGLLPPKATADQAHDTFLAMLLPDQVYEAHVNLITHGRLICQAQRPRHELCPIRARCRFVDPKAP